MELRGKACLVTGGAAGIGRAIAERFTSREASVLIADIDSGTGVVESRRIGAEFVTADVATEAGVRKMMAAVTSNYGRLDILVNNAGGVAPENPDDASEGWLRTLDLNLRGVMMATQLAIPLMAKDRGGVIINIASVAGLGLSAHSSPAYAASKAGVIRLTGALEDWGGRYGVRINCICPDWVDTPASRRLRSEMSPAELATLPPILSPEEVADAVVQMVLDETLTGRVMVVRGGETPRLLPMTDWRSV